MAQLILKKVKAATLIEVLVALVLIMVTFAIAIQIQLNTFKSAPTVVQTNVAHQLLWQLQQLQNGLVPFNEHELIDGITYQRSMLPYAATDSLVVYNISAWRNAQLLGQISGLAKLPKPTGHQFNAN